MATDDEQRLLRFNFRHAPWDDVLQWFCDQADLSFALDVTPTGTFTYVDEKRYTPGQALDLLNGVLLTKGYTLIRREKMLFVIDLEDEIDAELIRDLLVELPVERLDERGEYEVTKCRFKLDHVAPEDAEQQINQLLSPLGSIVVMPKAKQIVVTETGGTLRSIRDILQSLEKSAAEKSLHTFRLKNATAQEVLIVAKPLLGIPEDASASEDGSIRVSADPLGGTVYATGNAEKVALVKQVVEQVDGQVEESTSTGRVEAPQFMSHRVTSADPDAVLRVLQTVFAGDPEVRLEIHATSGDIIAWARPEQHKAIKATIAEMERHPESFTVMPLRRLDPALAVLLINKMYGQAEEGTGPDPPIVDAMLQPRQLIVRGTESQVQQIRGLLQQMGEPLTGSGEQAAMEQGNIRMLSANPATAQATLERIRQIWPTIRSNQVRIVPPAETIRTERPQGSYRADSMTRGPEEPTGLRSRRPPRDARRSSEPADSASPMVLPQTGDDRRSKRRLRTPGDLLPDVAGWREGSAGRTRLGGMMLAAAVDNAVLAQAGASAESPVEADRRSEDESNETAPADEGIDSDGALRQADGETGESEAAAGNQQVRDQDIIVAPQPNGGVVVASEDLEALNAFEALFRALSTQADAQSARFHLFYLQHIEAQAARDLLVSILSDSGGSGASSSPSSNGRSGEEGPGGVIEALMQRGTSALGAGSLIGGGVPSIVADNRLNSLFVQGSPEQIRLVGQLIDVIDQESGPSEVLTFPKPKFIPVYFTSVESVAEVVRQVFSDRLADSPQSRGRPDPAEFFRAAFGRGGDRGGGDRGGRGGSNPQTEGPKMTLGVDIGSNSLIVSAPGPLLKEVESVVEEIDRRANTADSDQEVAVVTLKRTNPEVVQQTLSNVFGDLVQTSGTTTGGSSAARSRERTASQQTPFQPPGFDPEAMRRRMEFFNRMRAGGGFGGGPSQRSGGGDRGGGGGRRGGGGGR